MPTLHGSNTCVMKADELAAVASSLARIGDARAKDVCTTVQARSICPGGKLNKKLLIGNVCQGISIAWWKRTHNSHHLATNSITHDPDIQHMPVLAVSPHFFKSPFSWYHFRVLSFDWVAAIGRT